MNYCTFYSLSEHSADVSGAFRSFTYLTAIMLMHDNVIHEDLKEKIRIEYECLQNQRMFSDEYDANVLADFICAVKNIIHVM